MVNPKVPRLHEKLWGSEEDLLHTTQVIDTIQLDVWGQSWNDDEDDDDEEEEVNMVLNVHRNHMAY